MSLSYAISWKDSLSLFFKKEVTLVSRMTLWRKANPQKAKQAARHDYACLSEQRKQKIRAAYTRQEQHLRQQVLELLGNQCVVCGFSDRRALQIDHINGGGYKAKLHKSVLRKYKLLLESKGEGYQLLCANCNQIKKHVNKEVRC